MKTRLRDEEDVLWDSAANLQRGIEAAGGWLYLTTHRLIFEAHAFNVQSGTTAIPLRDIAGARKCWTKFLGLIPIFPNSLAVDTVKGKTYRFVLFGRDEWLRAIRKARRKREDEDDR
ncbi:GRAM domain-containing protein [Gemmata sp. JC717]|uniref:GRAM domain-containing protein n=1 Tax=Gemmata algarum TaxID=2975278 RepID=A0ABU5F2M2_9BACT|nr:GRAM domain-containing protein [Gemmata algarum]MDY3555595.1 GRAM domain-containing protein [Gemmata algarum]MDY3561383.1 GRAM domain-containing protein [Gemmata algarum]